MTDQAGLSLLMGHGILPQRVIAKARAAEAEIGTVAGALSGAIKAEVLPIRAETSRKAEPPGEHAERWPKSGSARLVYEMLPEHALILAEAAFGCKVEDAGLAAAVVSRALEAPFEAVAGDSPEVIEDGAPLLSCTYCLDLRGEPVTLTVYLPTGRGARLCETPAFLRVAIAVEAAVGQMDLPVWRLASLRPGEVLRLEGSSLETISLRPRGRADILAAGELGKDTAKRAIRLTSIAA